MIAVSDSWGIARHNNAILEIIGLKGAFVRSLGIRSSHNGVTEVDVTLLLTEEQSDRLRVLIRDPGADLSGP